MCSCTHVSFLLFEKSLLWRLMYLTNHCWCVYRFAQTHRGFLRGVEITYGDHLFPSHTVWFSSFLLLLPLSLPLLPPSPPSSLPSFLPPSSLPLPPHAQALNYMGHTLSPQQQQKIHSSLDVDEQGKVVFLEFVKLAQEMFAFHLEDSHLEETLVFALTQKDSLEMPPIPKKVLIVIYILLYPCKLTQCNTM